MSTNKPRYFDVGLNITDSMFQGQYHGRFHHQNDTLQVLQKAYKYNVLNVLLTGSSLSESAKTIDIISSYKNTENIPTLHSTVGVHPCTVLEFEDTPTESVEIHLDNLYNLIIENKDIVKAFGEIGLDYDRLNYTPKDKQLLYFEKQLDLATKLNLPLFLHMRSCCDDFIRILKPYLVSKSLSNPNLLIHSFTGDSTELSKLLNLELETGYKIYISLNGASLRDTQTLEAIHLIPLNRLLIETDSPWCEIKKTHPSWKYLTKCPNEFYPFEYELSDEINEILKTSSKKSPTLSLFEFLPIPVVKSDKFDNFKHKELFDASPLIKSRNEPCLIGFVAQVVSKVINVDPMVIINNCYNNSMDVFG